MKLLAPSSPLPLMRPRRSRFGSLLLFILLARPCLPHRPRPCLADVSSPEVAMALLLGLWSLGCYLLLSSLLTRGLQRLGDKRHMAWPAIALRKAQLDMWPF